MVKLDDSGNVVVEGYYHCALHNFVCDITDTGAVKKHEEENEHTIRGTALCQRCKKVMVLFKNLPKPPAGIEPGAFCDTCKESLKKELGI